MKLYLDTGEVEEIRKAAASGLLDGVTTNPSLIAKSGRDLKEVANDIIRILDKQGNDFTISAEVYSDDWQGMVKEGLAYAKWSKHVLVKLPLTEQGLIACQHLTRKRIRCNVTLCFSPNQALLAAKAGAYVVSPFIGRIDDHGGDGMELIREIVKIYKNYGFSTQVLVASVRHPGHVREAALAGAHIATIPYAVWEKLFNHPLTEKGLATFKKDSQRGPPPALPR